MTIGLGPFALANHELKHSIDLRDTRHDPMPLNPNSFAFPLV